MYDTWLSVMPGLQLIDHVLGDYVALLHGELVDARQSQFGEIAA